MSVEKYTKFFMSKDKNNDGHLSLEELQDALKGHGYTRRQVKQIFNTADTSGDNKMSLEEFLVSMGACDPKVHRQATMTAVCRSFDTSGDGQIDKEELKAAINEMRGQGDQMTDEEASRLLELVDADGSGTISYKELLTEVFGYQMD